MQPLIRQLEVVRRRTRAMLLLMRGASWLAGVIAVAMLAGLTDYLLRLPGSLRLALLVAGIAVAGYYAFKFIGRAARVYPALPALALRLERLYPAAGGRLASAVAFAMSGARADESPVSIELALRSTRAAEGLVSDREVHRLIDPRPVTRSVILLAVTLLLFGGLALGAPESFAIAVQRWSDPLGSARWPNRYGVESLAALRFAPNNAPLPVSARVTKGDSENLRTWVVYTFLDKDGTPGPRQRVLMTRQTASNRSGLYERLIEPPGGADAVEFHFEAGDDATEPQKVKLIQPPSLAGLLVEVAPPGYATDLLPTDRHTPLQPPRSAVTIDALEGSRIKLLINVQGSLNLLGSEEISATQMRDWLGAALSGLLDSQDAQAYSDMNVAYRVVETSEGAATFEVAFTLYKPAQFRFRFADAYGTRYEDARLFGFEVRADRPPRAAVTEPATDQSVLPTAIIPVAAEGQDDVGVSQLDVTARTGSPPGGSGANQKPLAIGTGSPVNPRSYQAKADLDLTPLKLSVGDEVALVAVVKDNFQLPPDRVHEPVESPVRMVRIISLDELTRQLQAELADLRQRALRAKASQQQLLDSPAAPSSAQQQRDLSERLETIDRSVKPLQDRVERNRLDDDRLKEILTESRGLLAEAGKSSQQAAADLSSAAADPATSEQKTQQAREGQEQTAAKLDDLARLLDQGRDAYELRQKLIKLAKEQEALGRKVAQTMPRTLGRELDKLDAAQKQELSEAAKQQDDLAGEAKQVIERMRSTAAALARQSESPDDQAVAEAMRQAAEVGTREAVDQKMQQASKQVAQNRLTDAQQQQQQAQQVLKQMLEQMDRADQLKQDILRRKLAELVDAIRRLRDSQKAQLDRLVAAQKYDDLDAPMMTLRRNTQSVSETARQADPKAAPVAAKLDHAADRQGEAVAGLRAAEVSPEAVEVAERASLTALEEALKLAEELSDEAQEKQTEEERAKLVEAYKKAMEAQKIVYGETQRMSVATAEQRDRRWRADSIKLGTRQKAVGAGLTELGKQVEQTVVYKSVHEQIDRWIATAAGDLSLAQPSAATLFHQEMVLASIQALIDALGPDKPDEKFAEDESGGGGGGGGGPPPLIPPLAELKLLRARQTTVNLTTRAMDKVTDATVKPTILDEISRQQKSLAETGRELIQKMQQPQGLPPPGPGEPKP